MKGFVQDIEGLAVKNSEFRRVLYTAQHCQLVVMALKPKEEIGTGVAVLAAAAALGSARMQLDAHHGLTVCRVRKGCRKSVTS
jgi:hypothetical protein